MALSASRPVNVTVKNRTACAVPLTAERREPNANYFSGTARAVRFRDGKNTGRLAPYRF